MLTPEDELVEIWAADVEAPPVPLATNLTAAGFTPEIIGALAEAIAERLGKPASMLTEPAVLLSVEEASKIVGCSVMGLRKRILRHQIPPSCIVRSGTRVQLHRGRLLAALERKAGR